MKIEGRVGLGTKTKRISSPVIVSKYLCPGHWSAATVAAKELVLLVVGEQIWKVDIPI